MKILENNVFETEYISPTFGSDAHYTATVEYLFSLIQEVAGLHAKMRGCSIPDLKKEGRSWVITRTILDVKRYPTWPEKITMQTWAQGGRHFSGPRGTRAFDENGKELFHSRSIWAVIDDNTRKPIKMDDIEQRLHVIDKDTIDKNTELYFDPRFETRERLDENQEFQTTKQEVVFSDFDINRHVNNVIYLRWLINFMGDYLKDNKVSRVDISWLHEVNQKDEIRIKNQKKDNENWLFCIEARGDEPKWHVVSEAELTFKPRAEIC